MVSWPGDGRPVGRQLQRVQALEPPAAPVEIEYRPAVGQQPAAGPVDVQFPDRFRERLSPPQLRQVEGERSPVGQPGHRVRVGPAAARTGVGVLDRPLPGLRAAQRPGAQAAAGQREHVQVKERGARRQGDRQLPAVGGEGDALQGGQRHGRHRQRAEAHGLGRRVEVKQHQLDPYREAVGPGALVMLGREVARAGPGEPEPEPTRLTAFARPSWPPRRKREPAPSYSGSGRRSVSDWNR